MLGMVVGVVVACAGVVQESIRLENGARVVVIPIDQASAGMGTV